LLFEENVSIFAKGFLIETVFMKKLVGILKIHFENTYPDEKTSQGLKGLSKF